MVVGVTSHSFCQTPDYIPKDKSGFNYTTLHFPRFYFVAKIVTRMKKSY